MSSSENSPLVSSSQPPSYNGGKEFLLPHEERWRDRQPFLASHGYMLRPRLRPKWAPSWKTNGLPKYDCEDGIPLPWNSEVVDATRISDNKLVYIKHVGRSSNEFTITSMLSSGLSANNPQNHTTPLLEVLNDSTNDALSFLVFPFLRQLSEPPFEAVNEVVDFVDQILEGLSFLHQNGIALRNICHENIMMDATALYPNGFHPVAKLFLPDYSALAWPLKRGANRVKYYFVNYNKSTISSPLDSSPLNSRVQLSSTQLTDTEPQVDDSFKLDILRLGEVFRQEFTEIYSNLDFLHPIIAAMTATDPENRPHSTQLIEMWASIRETIPFMTQTWRLRKRDEVILEKVVYDTSSLVNCGIQFSKKLLGKM